MAKSYLDKDGLLYFLQKIRPNATPSMDGTASTGTAKRFALQDHVHPRDTTLAPKASPALTGTPTAPTAETGTSTTQIATTEFVANTVGAMTSGVSDVKMGTTSIVAGGIATIPEATSSANGYMTSAQASKLSGIAAGAEVNQNAFSNIATSGGTTITADGKTATLNLSAEQGVSITLNNTTKTVKVWGVTKTAASGGTDKCVVTTGEKYTWNNKADTTTATTSANGLMSSADKTKIDKLVFDGNNLIDSSILPSYVDDVIEAYARSGQTALSQNWLATGSASGTVITPEAGKIYVLMADSGDYSANTQFRWGGTAYVKLADGGVSSITNAEIDTIVAS